MKPNIEIEVLEDFYVEFNGELNTFDESFSHEFGTEKIIYDAVDEPVWDKKQYTDMQNEIIEEWLNIKLNKNKVCELLTEKMKECKLPTA